IFPVIIGLISLSLIGIIYIQVSWLDNMVLLREDQLHDKMTRVTEEITRELSTYKGTPPANRNRFRGLNEDLLTSDFFKPYLVGSRLTSQEIYEKIRKAFNEHKLEDVPFEFALTATLAG